MPLAGTSPAVTGGRESFPRKLDMDDYGSEKTTTSTSRPFIIKDGAKLFLSDLTTTTTTASPTSTSTKQPRKQKPAYYYTPRINPAFTVKASEECYCPCSKKMAEANKRDPFAEPRLLFALERARSYSGPGLEEEETTTSMPSEIDETTTMMFSEEEATTIPIDYEQTISDENYIEDYETKPEDIMETTIAPESMVKEDTTEEPPMAKEDLVPELEVDVPLPDSVTDATSIEEEDYSTYYPVKDEVTPPMTTEATEEEEVVQDSRPRYFQAFELTDIVDKIEADSDESNVVSNDKAPSAEIATCIKKFLVCIEKGFGEAVEVAEVAEAKKLPSKARNCYQGFQDCSGSVILIPDLYKNTVEEGQTEA